MNMIAGPRSFGATVIIMNSQMLPSLAGVRINGRAVKGLPRVVIILLRFELSVGIQNLLAGVDCPAGVRIKAGCAPCRLCDVVPRVVVLPCVFDDRKRVLLPVRLFSRANLGGAPNRSQAARANVTSRRSRGFMRRAGQFTTALG